MKLFQHSDFEQAILAAEAHFHSNRWMATFIEKDYYTTEALRLIAAEVGDKVIFKGGTSLSKGWDIVQRFSEDLDLFFDPQAFDPHLGKNGIDRELRNLRQKTEEHPAFTFLQEPSRTIGGTGRNDYFEYAQRFGGIGGMTNRILCEVGTASGRQPTEEVAIRSYLGRFLNETGVSMGCEDEGPFTLRLLHFRRTFVEKLFAIHAKVELYLRDGDPVGTYSRHYYDLYQLGQRREVLEMLRSDEYTQIKEDYEQISLRHYPRGYFRPDQMSFANSRALFPPGELAEQLGENYQRQCQLLCFGPFPAWTEVLQLFEDLRFDL